MDGAKEMFLRMRMSDYESLPPQVRSLFTYEEVREVDEYQNNKDDPNYIKLHKAKRTAAKEVQKYLFNKRHNN
jgi:hypothetical protein